MTRPIDADALKEMAFDVLVGGGNYESAVLIEDIDNAPTMDVLPLYDQSGGTRDIDDIQLVTKCKNCKYGTEDYPKTLREEMDEKWKDIEQTYSCEHSTYSHDPDFFCAYGERREE